MTVTRNALLKPLYTAASYPEKWLYGRGLLSSAQLVLPDFLGIGAAQSGSTWLHSNLQCHRDLYLPDKKELHFFDRNFHRSLRWYSRRFQSGREMVKGEISPGYSVLSLDRIRFVRQVMPSVKLIFIMRNPIERDWSAVRRRFSTMTEGSVEDVPEAKVYAQLKGEYSRRGHYEPGLKRGQFTRIIDNWVSVFPERQLFIGVFDDLVDRPQQLLRRIFRFLNVPQDVNWDDFLLWEPINRNPQMSMPEKYRDYLEDLYREEIEDLHRRFGVPDTWRCRGDNKPGESPR